MSYKNIVHFLLPILLVSHAIAGDAAEGCNLQLEKFVALTFDDGPSPETTPAIMKILKQFDAKATFFVTGKNAQRFKSQMVDVHKAGHELANHSYSHPVLTRVSNERVRSELDVTSKIIAETTGETPIWFRPPYGSINNKIRGIASDLGMKTIIWTEDPRDWSRTATAGSIERVVMATLHSGSVVLMHDNHQATIDALPSMMKRMQHLGYKFVTVSELKSQEEQFLAQKSAVCRLPNKAHAPVHAAPQSR